MEQGIWKQFDEEYLIGISNKGIVKRANKDMEAGIVCRLMECEEENRWQVAVGEEQVTVALPVAESICSCPSRNICRHVIQAVLYLQQMDTAGENNSENETKTDEMLLSGGEDVVEEKSGGIPQQLMDEMSAYPLKKLTRALGIRGCRNFIAGLSSAKPVISYGNVVTVQIPERGVTVKLLSPLNYSSCTCHRKELCVHKAEAVLWCLLEQGILTKDQLTDMEAGEAGYDAGQIQKVSQELETFLEDVFFTGLSRCAKDVMEYLERLAILCHNAELARYEGYCRGLKDDYEQYFRHSAAFEVRALLSKLVRLSRQVKALGQAKDNQEIAALAGEFRGNYLPAGDLDLVGITMEHFVTQTGYEGDTVYFLERQTGNWYTYSNARPTFYENQAKGFTKKAEAPWELPVLLEDLYKVTLHLDHAKCDAQGRLSGTSETKAEIVEQSTLDRELMRDWYFDDFAALYQKWFVEGYGGEHRRRNLVFVDAHALDEAGFSETDQTLTLSIYDKKGRELVILMDYSKREASAIRYLEKLQKKQHYCFLGRIYLKNGKIHMYPVAVYKGSENPYYEGKKLFGYVRKEAEHRAGSAKQTAQVESCEAVEEILEEVESLLVELFQSGFATIYDSTLRGLMEQGKMAEQIGLLLLSDMLQELSSRLEQGRHQMNLNIQEILILYRQIYRYLLICRERTGIDRGLCYYGEGK
ncbi:MAG: hypothetical protein NC347_01155 [Clostridium sp.]|nr:hypothetical protein [Clostridium sp.]